MQIQTVFRAGNSPFAVAIPTALAEEVRFKTGEKVVVQKMDEDAVVIRRARISKQNKTAAEKEFETWIKRTLKEDAGILDELAVR